MQKATGILIRLGKWTAAVFAGVCILLAVAALIFTSFIDQNRYRHEVESIVADLAGRPLVIEGDLRITWFPWLGVRMGAAHLNNRPEFGGPPLAEWQSLAVAAKVLPLLRGRVVLDRIRLQSPHVHLRRDSQGHGNWEDLGPRQATLSDNSSAGVGSSASRGSATGKGSSARPESSSDGTGSPASTGTSAGKRQGPSALGGIEIRDGELDYTDEITGRHYSVSDWRLDMGEWRVRNPLSVQTRFLAHSESLPASGVWVQLEAAELAVGMDPLSIRSPQLSVRIADAQLSGPLTFQQTYSGLISANGSVTAHVPAIRKLAANFGLADSLPRDPTVLGKLELQTNWNYTGVEFVAKPLQMGIDDTSFNGWIARSAAPQAAWRFELHADRIDLGRYLDIDTSKKHRPFELPVPALRALNANGSVKFDRIRLTDTYMTDVRLSFQTPDSQP